MRVRNYPGIERLSPEATRALVKGAKARGWKADDLLGHIYIESIGFKTDAKNPHSSASGLIQMTDASARTYAGVSAEKLRTMSDVEQVPGILKYFDIGKPLKGADFRLLGYSRNKKLIGAPDSFVLYAADTRAAKLHPKLVDADGSITAGSVRREWARKMAKREEWQWIEVADDPPVNKSSSGFGPLAVLGTLVAFMWLRKGGGR